ncbi:MAG: efflux RND transporter periplasmic adaptor subunit [Deltaproteobacteria bacterium]|nr:efflux RND transporter periplasmic adaptor subunit [Deltaproteobacteria bacterium]
MKNKIAVFLFLVLLFGVSLLVYMGHKQVKQEEMYYSGTIEATTSALAFQVGGKVIEVPVDEGYEVKNGEVLAVLDGSEYQSRYDEAGAIVERSGENLKQLEVLLGIYRDTLPAEVERARSSLISSQDVVEEAGRDKARYDALVKDNLVSEQEWDRVNLVYDTARAKLVQDGAILRQAQGNLRKIEATEKEIAATKAQIKAAQASLQLAAIHLGYTTLRAPFKGIITSRSIEPGEVVSPGSEAFTLSDLSTVDLKIFVDETEIGKVKPGQDVDVRIDTFPDKVYHGMVAFISPEGEFTPKIIQTHKERVKLVYLVKISLPNPSLELKSGMPADAWLR